MLRVLGLLTGALALGLAVAFLVMGPEPPPDGSESAERLAPGPFRVGSSDHVFVDEARPTAANGDFAGAPNRTLEATLWYPEDATGPHALLVYSHGFMSWRTEHAALAELAASHGYVVVSVDFPLTNLSAPGGPNATDVVNQPGDLSFVIDEMLGWGPGERPFEGGIDPERIGTLGVSLGGLTTILVTYHPRLRDPRIRASLSIAGLASFFDERFFAHADPPFLMLAGTADALVPYETNAEPIPRLVSNAALLSVGNGTHTGFVAASDRFPNRLIPQPDAMGCFMLRRNLDPEAEPPEGYFASLGDPEDGVISGSRPPPCASGLPDAPLAPGRQLMITRLAALAFFGSHFASDAEERAAHGRYLRDGLANDFPETRYEGQERDRSAAR
ncbi:MAG: hypothetical protein P8R42_13130 [Candidatus Binatia bacterium]|nr:hypothetical protein [Candidatus Binatia bacterium]